MKKYFLTWALITITATTLYATTAGSTVVDKMKAAAHSFTLATSLNPTDTGLTSAPLVGKKTGDVLTAGEYNRLLEMIAQGSVGWSSSWVDVPLTDTSDFDDNCDYRVKLSSVWNLPGWNKDDWIYSPDRIGKKVINWSNSIVIQSATKNVLWWQWSSNDTYANVSAAWGLNITKIEKLCGGGGSGSLNQTNTGVSSRAKAVRASGYTLNIPTGITDWPNTIVCDGYGGLAGWRQILTLDLTGNNLVWYTQAEGVGVYFNPSTGVIAQADRVHATCGASAGNIATICAERRCVD